MCVMALPIHLTMKSLERVAVYKVENHIALPSVCVNPSLSLSAVAQVHRGGEGEATSSGSHAIWAGSSQLYWDEVCHARGQTGPHHTPGEIQVCQRPRDRGQWF